MSNFPANEVVKPSILTCEAHLEKVTVRAGLIDFDGTPRESRAGHLKSC